MKMLRFLNYGKMRDDTANEAIKNADIELIAKKVVVKILRLAKKYGFNYDSDIALVSDENGRRYVRKVVKAQTEPPKPEPKKPKTLLEFIQQMNKNNE